MKILILKSLVSIVANDKQWLEIKSGFVEYIYIYICIFFYIIGIKSVILHVNYSFIYSTFLYSSTSKPLDTQKKLLQLLLISGYKLQYWISRLYYYYSPMRYIIREVCYH